MTTLSTTETGIPIDPVKLYRIKLKHRLSNHQLAELTGIPRTTIIGALQRIDGLIHLDDDREAFTNAKVSVLSALEEQLMASLADPDKLAKASLNNIAYAFTQIHQASRLEQGKSTENVGVLSRYISQSNKQLFEKHTPQVVVPEVVDVTDTK